MRQDIVAAKNQQGFVFYFVLSGQNGARHTFIQIFLLNQFCSIFFCNFFKFLQIMSSTHNANVRQSHSFQGVQLVLDQRFSRKLKEVLVFNGFDPTTATGCE
ncbi:MAG: hypothetical protein WC777_01165 [Candidatus Gracilibacteria bacterium]